jgi:broad specificity phosphatase PhoE
MVGLPARGKTYIARKLGRYLSWLGYQAKVFNVGNYRRERYGDHVPPSFFDPGNQEAWRQRREVAAAALDDLLAWSAEGGQVGIYDATNSTRERRAYVSGRCEQPGLRVLFVETVCDDPAVIDVNIRETKLSAPDYRDIDPDDAVRDFRERLSHYERAYQPVSDESASFIKIIDVGRQVVANRIQGHLAGRIVNFVMHLHPTPRPIWLTRHGESEDNTRGHIGGDSPLSEAGQQYAASLRDFVVQRSAQNIVVWSSTLQRTLQTADRTGREFLPIKALDEIDSGLCDGMSYAEIRKTMPEEFEARSEDKLRYRYPRGESYEDVIRRLDPILIEIERHREPLLIIAHQAVLRCLYAYIADEPRERCPYLSVPLHTVIELTPRAYGCDEARFELAPGERMAASS